MIAIELSSAGLGLAAGLAAAGVGYLLFRRVFQKRLAVRQEESLALARVEAERIQKEAQLAARDEQLRLREAFEKELEGVKKELEDRQERLRKREDALDKKIETFAKKERFLEKTERTVSETKKKLEDQQAELAKLVEEEKRALHTVSNLTREQAIEMYFSRLEQELAVEAAETIRRTTERVEKESKEKAQEILALAIQRCAAAHTAATVVTTVDLPSDELKGRIIGREGRNIRAFEKATGVDVIVDDTPGVVVLSGFDGVRRDVAKRAMEKLIADSRIHPARIEEVVAGVRKEHEKMVIEIGKKAGYDLGVHGLHPREIQLLGKLNFVTSGGRSALAHSIDVAQICGALAGEFGLDVQKAKRIGLLHDIGRAADHDMEGSHSAAGADIARRCEEHKTVVDAIAAHHNEVPATTLYGVVLQIANAVSNDRPGSSHEGVEKLLKRLSRLEEIAKSFPGVVEAYAVQTGREIRVMVDPGVIPDRVTPKLSRDIARAIESQMSYPGEIQVTVLREVRVKGFAKKV